MQVPSDGDIILLVGRTVVVEVLVACFLQDVLSYVIGTFCTTTYVHDDRIEFRFYSCLFYSNRSLSMI